MHKKLPTLRLVQDKADIHVISSPEEQGLWETLSVHGVPIYSGEAIVKSVLKQEIDFEEYSMTVDD